MIFMLMWEENLDKNYEEYIIVDYDVKEYDQVDMSNVWNKKVLMMECLLLEQEQ